MLARLKSKKTAADVVGLALQNDGVALAVNRGAGSRFYCDYLSVSGAAAQAEQLGKWVKKYGLQKAATVAVMPAEAYSLLQLSSPAMKQAELRAAVKWRIRDLISFPAEQAVVDVFEFPQSGQRGTERLLYVAAAKAMDVQHCVDLVKSAGLRLRAIDIGELALRNIMACLPENSEGIVLLYLAAHSGMVVFVKDAELYLARRLDLGLENLKDASQAQEVRLVEQIQLELQRSLDYFEAHFSQPLPAKLLIYPAGNETRSITAQINELLSMQVENFAHAEIFNFEKDSHAQTRCLLAMGAALRDLQDAL